MWEQHRHNVPERKAYMKGNDKHKESCMTFELYIF